MSRVRYALISMGKGLLAGVIWQVGLIVGSLVTPLLGFETPAVPPGVDPSLVLPLGVLVGIPVAITLGELNKRLQLPFMPRVLTLFAFNYLVYGLGQVLEQVLFTTTTSLGCGSVSHLFQAACLALAVAALWRPQPAERSFAKALARLLNARRPGDQVWRLIVAWLIYLPIYWGMGRLVSPLVAPLYEAECKASKRPSSRTPAWGSLNQARRMPKSSRQATSSSWPWRGRNSSITQAANESWPCLTTRASRPPAASPSRA